jgi:hypothetical protein
MRASVTSELETRNGEAANPAAASGSAFRIFSRAYGPPSRSGAQYARSILMAPVAAGWASAIGCKVRPSSVGLTAIWNCFPGAASGTAVSDAAPLPPCQPGTACAARRMSAARHARRNALRVTGGDSGHEARHPQQRNHRRLSDQNGRSATAGIRLRELPESRAKGLDSVRVGRRAKAWRRKWWAVAGSNRGPPACKAGALTN